MWGKKAILIFWFNSKIVRNFKRKYEKNDDVALQKAIDERTAKEITREVEKNEIGHKKITKSYSSEKTTQLVPQSSTSGTKDDWNAAIESLITTIDTTDSSDNDDDDCGSDAGPPAVSALICCRT